MHANLIFRIKNNGWVSKPCSMSRGIRQGCPISALMYLFVAKTLSSKLKTNDQIKSIHLNNTSTGNIKSLVEYFCNHAGSTISKKNTVCTLRKSQRQIRRSL